jgi:rod shape-determining protein MreD
MRKAWLAPVLILVALVLQLTVLNGLRLPGDGVPDLVLVLVAALAMTEGPVPGMVTGFAAGLCLDLAPPGSPVIGQYALVFCLAGFAAGRLSGAGRRSPLLAAVIVAAVVAAAEALSAALGLVLEPAQVTIAEVRLVLPATLGYDVLLCPFVLYLIVLAGALLADPLGGQVRGPLARPARSQLGGKGKRKPKPAELRLGPAAARTGDGWIGSRPGRQHGAHPPARHGARLRPAGGVAGSASGLLHHRDRPTAPVSIRLTTGRRGDGVIGNPVGTGLGHHWQPGRHPRRMAGASDHFRPHPGDRGGSAARPYGMTRPGTGQARGRVTINFGGHRGDGSVGQSLGTSRLTGLSRGGTPGPQLRMGARRSPVAVSGRIGLAAAVPTVHFGAGSARTVRRPVAVPKFRRQSAWFRAPGMATGLVSGGVLDQSAFRAARRRAGTPRLRLAGRSRGALMLGGSGGPLLRRPPGRIRRQPRFGYGRRSLLSFLTGRHIGGHWLASKRVGSRSGVWLIGRRTGGLR